MIQIKTSTGGLEALISRLKHFDASTVNDKIQEIIKDDIKSRMEKGLDVNGKQMEPYTEQYKKKREKAGKPIDHVYMRWTGHLIDNLIGSKAGIITTITPDEEDMMKAKGNQAKRNWFGISITAKDKIKAYVREFVGVIINGK